MAVERTWDYTRSRTWARRYPTRVERVQRWWDAKVRRVKMAWAIWSTIFGWSDAQLCDTAFFLAWWPKACEADRAVVCEVTRALGHPAWPTAQEAVRRTSQTLGFNKKQAWTALASSITERREWAQSVWRHLHAMKGLDLDAAPYRLTTHERHLLVELAYLHHARYGKRERGVSA